MNDKQTYKQDLIDFTETACDMLKTKFFNCGDELITKRFVDGKVNASDMRVAFWINEEARIASGSLYSRYRREYFPLLRLNWLSEKERKSMAEDRIMHQRMCEALLPLRHCINQMVLDGFKMSKEAISELMLDTVKHYDFGIPSDKFYEPMVFALQEIPLMIANTNGVAFTQMDFDRKNDSSFSDEGISTDILSQYTKNIMNIMCSPRNTMLEGPHYSTSVKMNIPAYVLYMNRHAHAVYGHSSTTHAFIEFCVKAGFNINSACMIEALLTNEVDFESEMDFLRENGFNIETVFESENDYFIKNRFAFSSWITKYLIDKCGLNLFEGVTDGWELINARCFNERILQKGIIRQAPNWNWIKDEISRNHVTFTEVSSKRSICYRNPKFWENIFAITDFNADIVDGDGLTALQRIKTEWCKAPAGTSSKSVRVLLMKTAKVFIENGGNISIIDKYGNNILSIHNEAEELFVNELKKFLPEQM